MYNSRLYWYKYGNYLEMSHLSFHNSSIVQQTWKFKPCRTLYLSPTDYGCILERHCHTRKPETPSSKIRIPLFRKKLPGWFPSRLLL